MVSENLLQLSAAARIPEPLIQPTASDSMRRTLSTYEGHLNHGRGWKPGADTV